MHPFRCFINLNRKASQWFDRIFMSPSYRIDGNTDYMYNLVRSNIKRGDLIYDVGGGKSPFFTVEEKKTLSLRIVGIDISNEELSRAPAGAYDQVSARDITQVDGDCNGDVVICQAVLEHVTDTKSAIRAIASLLKVGGRALIFVPSRNALYARINMLLPQKLKERILYWVYPETHERRGFPSYYNLCTPRDIYQLAQISGMTVEHVRYYYKSSYFEVIFPVYILWRINQLIMRFFIGNQSAETFSMVMVKR